MLHFVEISHEKLPNLTPRLTLSPMEGYSPMLRRVRVPLMVHRYLQSLEPVGLTSSWSPPPSLSVMVLVLGLAALTLVSDKNIVVHPLNGLFVAVYQKCTIACTT